MALINIFIFLGLFYIFSLTIGKLLEKIRIPWIFGALLLGTIFAFWDPIPAIVHSPSIKFLGDIGMYLLLFLIGLELDIEEIMKQKGFIIEATAVIIPFEAVFGSLIVHYLFGYNWLISVVVALSFATVGESILIPILDEFNAVNTIIGETIISIGTLDDIFELLTLIAAGYLIMNATHATGNVSAGINDALYVFGGLIILSLLTWFMSYMRRYNHKFKRAHYITIFVFGLFIFFLFLGIGVVAGAEAIGAVFAGFAIKQFLPENKINGFISDARLIAYGLFSPIFFFNIGADVDPTSVFKYPLLIILVVVVSKAAKLISSIIVGYKKMGIKKSIVLGIGLSVRFSTSIVVISMLYYSGVIGAKLFTVIVASSIIFKFLVPVLFANLLVKWGLDDPPIGKHHSHHTKHLKTNDNIRRANIIHNRHHMV